jgi:hypothetical protein
MCTIFRATHYEVASFNLADYRATAAYNTVFTNHRWLYFNEFTHLLAKLANAFLI